jgi:hypothetical protein
MSGGAARTTITTKINRHRPRDTKRHTNMVGSLVGSDDELLLLLLTLVLYVVGEPTVHCHFLSFCTVFSVKERNVSEPLVALQ